MFACLLVCVCALSVVSGQVFQTKIQSPNVSKGTVFEVAFTLSADEGMHFTPPRFPGFKVISGPYENSSTLMVNGKVSAEKSWVYELKAEQVGQFTIGAASVISGGRTWTTQPVNIKVTESKGLSALPSGANPKCFISGELDHPVAFPGQQVTWRIRIYTQVDVEGSDIIELPDFAGFYNKEKRRFDTRVQQMSIKGKQYVVKTLHEEALFPQASGTLTIGAAQVRLLLPEPGPFGMSIPRPVVMQTEPLTLKVTETPVGAPESFTGAVGKYDWDVQADSLNISTDGAVTVKITFKGDGDSRRFTAPKLKMADGLEVFEPRILEEEEYESISNLMHTKSFEYVILPKTPGNYAFTPEFSYLNPDSNAYVTLKIEHPDTIRVVAGKNYHPEAEQDSILAQSYHSDQDNASGVGFWTWFGKPWLWLLLLLPFLGFVLFRILRKNKESWILSTGDTGIGTLSAARKENLKSERSQVKQNEPVQNKQFFSAQATSEKANDSKKQSTYKSHLDKAQEAAGAGLTRVFYDEMLKALEEALTDKLQLSKSQLNADNVLKTMSARNFPAALTQNVLSLWQTCEQALFAGQAHAGQVEHTLRFALGIFDELGRV